jgi:transposase, IS5 family
VLDRTPRLVAADAAFYSANNGQKWRTGCEGRISVTKRRHGLNRCRYKGDRGMKRWVGLGVIADTLINIGCAMAQAAVES